MKRLRSFLGHSNLASNHNSHRYKRLAIEMLESRELLAGDCLSGLPSGDSANGTDAELHVLFDVGTPQSYVDQVHAATGHDDSQDANISRYQASTRWSTTTTDGGGLSWGDGTTITWSIAPDGTSIGGFAGEAAAPSNFVSFMAGIYGSTSGGIEDQPWFDVVASTFDR